MRYSRRVAAFLRVLFVPVLAAGTHRRSSAAGTVAVAPDNPVAAQSLDQLSATLNRPLFSPSRRPPAPPPPAAAGRVGRRAVSTTSSATEPGSFGVVIDGEDARAVVRTAAGGKLLRAQIGDDIEGWKVSQIEGRKVVLSLDGRFATFTLFSDDREKREAAGAPMAGAEPKTPQRQIQAQQTPPQAAAPQPGQPRKRRHSRE